MEVQALVAILVSICIGLIGIVYWIHRGEIAGLKTMAEDLKQRTQKLEDIHTIKIDQVAAKLDKLEQKFEELAYNIHKEKNIEGQMLQIMNLVYKELSKRDENNK